jgi:Arabinose-binding domain of AraC transcription regulator, N-term
MQSHLPSIVLTGAAALLEVLSARPELVASGAGLPELALRSAHVPIRGGQMLRFLSLAADVTQCRNFGLRLAEYQGLAVLGPILVMMHGTRTIGKAMETLAEFYVLHTSMSSVRAARNEQGMVLTYDLENASGPGEIQAIELGLANGMQYLRSVCGTGWRPVVVQLRHASPADRIARARVRSFPALQSGQECDCPGPRHGDASRDAISPKRASRARGASPERKNPDWGTLGCPHANNNSRAFALHGQFVECDSASAGNFPAVLATSPPRGRHDIR